MTDLINAAETVAETAALGPVAIVWKAVKPWVLKGALLATIVGFSFVSGCEYRVRHELKQEAAKVPAIVHTITKREIERQTVYVKDEALVRKLQNDNYTLQTKNDALKALVNLYVPDQEGGPGRYVSPCAVRLLDEAADGITSGQVVSASLSACESSSPGSFTWGQLVQDGIDLRGKYNALKAKDDALIDEIDEHIVNAPITDPTKSQSSDTH
jgi:hypothetical protein